MKADIRKEWITDGGSKIYQRVSRRIPLKSIHKEVSEIREWIQKELGKESMNYVYKRIFDTDTDESYFSFSLGIWVYKLSSYGKKFKISRMFHFDADYDMVKTFETKQETIEYIKGIIYKQQKGKESS